MSSNYLVKRGAKLAAAVVLAAVLATVTAAPASAANRVRPIPHANGVVRVA